MPPHTDAGAMFAIIDAFIFAAIAAAADNLIRYYRGR